MTLKGNWGFVIAIVMLSAVLIASAQPRQPSTAHSGRYTVQIAPNGSQVIVLDTVTGKVWASMERRMQLRTGEDPITGDAMVQLPFMGLSNEPPILMESPK